MRIRTGVLNALAATPVARWWARRQCGKYGISLRRIEGAIELSKGSQRVRLAPKHIFYAVQVCDAFDSLARLMPNEPAGVVTVADFAGHPERLNIARECLRRGATIESREGKLWLIKNGRAMILAERHLIYTPDLTERFDLYFEPLVSEQRDGLRVLDFSRPGNLQRYAKSGLEFEMASWPEEEDAIEEYFRWYRPEAGDLVFDIGAHCGVSTYHMSKLVGPEGRVIAFEPDPGNLELLKRNVARHGLGNVSVQQAAIAGQAGRLPFSADGTIGSTLSALQGRQSVGAEVLVDVVTLEQAFAAFGTPRFCKIDIEGAEIEAIEAAQRAIGGNRIDFAVDTSHLQADGVPTKDRVEALFQSCGYDALSEARPLWTTWARPAGTGHS